MRASGKDGASRPLVEGERDLIEALLGASGSAGWRFIDQLETATVVGGCACGCPSIDLFLDHQSAGARPTPLVMADAVAPEGTPVGVILWVCGGALSRLEVHPWDNTSVFGLPRPETLDNLHTGSD